MFPMNTQKYSLLFFLLSLLIPPFFVECFFSLGFYFAWFLFSRVQNTSYFRENPIFALLYFSLGSYFRVSKMVLIFAGPKNRENKNTRSLKPRNGEPCELFDVYSSCVLEKKNNCEKRRKINGVEVVCIITRC